MEIDLKRINANTLYKYRFFDSNNHHIKTISENKFYFASPKELNDPFDLLRNPYKNLKVDELITLFKIDFENNNFKIDQNLINNLETNLRNDPEYLNKYFQNSFANDIFKMKICSFSADTWNNILMWSHYCNSHTGFVVGIDFNILIQDLYLHQLNFNKSILATKVNYITSFPNISYEDLIDGHSFKLYRDLFASKYKIWKHEKEVRLIMFDSSNNILQINSKCINEIILGLYCSKENEQLIIDILLEKDPKPKLYKIFQKEKSFELERREIEY